MTRQSTHHLLALLQHDLDAIRAKLLEMVDLDEQALRGALQAVLELDRQLAYSVILRDRYVDELEAILDRMCLEFLLRHQPAAGILRFVYSTSKIVKELERIGDYAETIARQAVQIDELPADLPRDLLVDMAGLVIQMVHQSVQAFVDGDAELSRLAMAKEGEADRMRNVIIGELTKLREREHLTVEAFSPLLSVPRLLERAADQAYNICEETLFCTTGNYVKHKPPDRFRIVFVGETNGCLTQMAEAIASALGEEKCSFASAGLTAGQLDARAVDFMKSKGLDISGRATKSVFEIREFDRMHVIIGLCRAARKVFPPSPTKTVGLVWPVVDPSKVQGDPDTIRAAYATAYDYLDSHIRHLVQAILGEGSKEQP